MCTSGGHTKVPPNSCWGPLPCFWGLSLSFWGVKSRIFKVPKSAKFHTVLPNQVQNEKVKIWTAQVHFESILRAFWRKIKIYQSYFHQVAHFSLFGLFCLQNPRFSELLALPIFEFVTLCFREAIFCFLFLRNWPISVVVWMSISPKEQSLWGKQTWIRTTPEIELASINTSQKSSITNRYEKSLRTFKTRSIKGGNVARC